MKRLLLLLVFLGPSVLAADYYVDGDSGDDTNSGLAPADAWATLQRCEAPPFLPGDTCHVAPARYPDTLKPMTGLNAASRSVYLCGSPGTCVLEAHPSIEFAEGVSFVEIGGFALEGTAHLWKGGDGNDVHDLTSRAYVTSSCGADNVLSDSTFDVMADAPFPEVGTTLVLGYGCTGARRETNTTVRGVSVIGGWNCIDTNRMDSPVFDGVQARFCENHTWTIEFNNDAPGTDYAIRNSILGPSSFFREPHPDVRWLNGLVFTNNLVYGGMRLINGGLARGGSPLVGASLEGNVVIRNNIFIDYGEATSTGNSFTWSDGAGGTFPGAVNTATLDIDHNAYVGMNPRLTSVYGRGTWRWNIGGLDELFYLDADGDGSVFSFGTTCDAGDENAGNTYCDWRDGGMNPDGSGRDEHSILVGNVDYDYGSDEIGGRLFGTSGATWAAYIGCGVSSTTVDVSRQWRQTASPIRVGDVIEIDRDGVLRTVVSYTPDGGGGGRTQSRCQDRLVYSPATPSTPVADTWILSWGEQDPDQDGTVDLTSIADQERWGFTPVDGSPIIDAGDDAHCGHPVAGSHCDIGPVEAGAAANRAPDGSLDSTSQRRDGSGIVDISVSVGDPDADDASLRIWRGAALGSGRCASMSAKLTDLDESAGALATLPPAPDVANGNEYQVGTVVPIRTTGTNTVTFGWRSGLTFPLADGSVNSQLSIWAVAYDGDREDDSPSCRSVLLDHTPPTRPGPLTVAASTATSVTLDLSDAPVAETNFEEYAIYYKAATSGVTRSDRKWGKAQDPNLGSRAFTGTTTITGLSPGTRYVFNVIAYDRFCATSQESCPGNVSPFSSAEVTATTASGPGQPTVEVSHLFRDAEGRVKIALTVDDPDGDAVNVAVAYHASDFIAPCPGAMERPTLGNLGGNALGAKVDLDLPYQIQNVDTSSGPVTVTIDWTDPPANAAGAGDLCVSFTANDGVSDGTTVYGDSGTDCTETGVLADLAAANNSVTGYVMTFNCEAATIGFTDTGLGEIGADRVTIDGAGQDVTFRYLGDFTGCTPCNTNSPPIATVTGAGFALLGLTFTDFLESIHLLDGADGARIQRVRFQAHECSDDAISPLSTTLTGILIDSNSFQDYCDKAIQSMLGSGTITGNTFTRVKQPIRAPYDNSAGGPWTISGNTMAGDDTAACEGPWFSGSYAVDFRGNTIQDCRRGLYVGSPDDRSFGGGVGILVHDNIITSNLRFGILIRGLTSASVFDNTVTDNGVLQGSLPNGGIIAWTDSGDDDPTVDLGGGLVTIQGIDYSSVGHNIIQGNDGGGERNVRNLASRPLSATTNCWDGTSDLEVQTYEVEGSVDVQPLGVESGAICEDPSGPTNVLNEPTRCNGKDGCVGNRYHTKKGSSLVPSP